MDEDSRTAGVDWTLAELFAGCRANRGEAVTELVRRFRPWVLDLATAMVDDKESAEDVAQEAFVAAIQRLNDLREPEAFPGWLRKIVRTYARRATRRQHPRTLSELPEQSTPDESPAHRLELEELRRQVRRAVESLPPAGCETVTLFYLNEMSCGQIGNLLGVPAGTVKRRLHDARKRLRGMLLGVIGEDIGVTEDAPGRPSSETPERRET
jgi:RNA polymerase sigma-70 factor (ECF subfamily)